ncbi:MAG: NAD-binding protein, partial [Candidatus Woesearchaeota archaeon]
MKVVIYGAGKTGLKLAKSLYDEGADIVVIDKDSKKLSIFIERLDVLCVEGHIGEDSTVKKADIKNAKVFVAVEDIDEENIIACMIAKRLGVKKTLARLRNPTYFDSNLFDYGAAGIDHIVNPEKEVAFEIFKIISTPLATDVDSVVREKLSLLEMRVSDFEKDYLINKLHILDETHNIIVINPIKNKLLFYDKNTHLSDEDFIYILHTTNDINSVNNLFYDRYPKIKNVMIIGGGQTASELLKLLEKTRVNVKIFEISEKRCSILNNKHKKAMVLCGDATDLDTLLQEELEKIDCFISLMGDDENNMVLSIFAKHKGIRKVITKISKPYGTDLLDNIAITVPVDINRVTVNKIRG